jgi:hypothetical protein
MNEIKELLVDAVPPLQAPPNRLADIQGRAATRRQLRRAGTAVATVAAVVALGVTMTVLTPAAPAERFGGSPPYPSSAGSSGPPVEPSAGSSSAPVDTPPPAPGVCPPIVNLFRDPTLGEHIRGTLPPISVVTLCRYTSSGVAGDLDDKAALRAGPANGDLTKFLPALSLVLTPQEFHNPGPCLDPSPGQPPYLVDVIYVHSPDGTTNMVPVPRKKCANLRPEDQSVALQTALDEVLGSPYQ